VNEAFRQEGNQLLGLGLGIGAWGAASGVLLGAVCPVCVVAAPALVGAGLLRRWQASRPGRPVSEEPGKEKHRG
jgi:hypothetical protein